MDDNQVRALDAVEQATLMITNEFHTKKGVILRTRKVKTTIIQHAWRALQEPKAPMIFIAELGRYEENPNDPGYVEALSNYHLAKGSATVNVYLMMGCDPKFIPEDVFGINDDGWTLELQELDMNIPGTDKPGARKVAWLQYYVLEDIQETAELQKQIMRQSGLVLAEDVQEVENSFRDK